MKIIIGLISLTLLASLITLFNLHSKINKVDAQLSTLNEKISAVSLQNKRTPNNNVQDNSINNSATSNPQENEDPLGRTEEEISKQIEKNKSHLKQYQQALKGLNADITEALKPQTSPSEK